MARSTKPRTPTHPGRLAASTLAECHQRSQTWLEQVRCPYQLLQCPIQHQCGPQGCPRGNYQWLGGRGRDGQTSVSNVNSAASVGAFQQPRTAYSVGGLRVCATRDAPQVDGSISTTSEAQATLGIAAHNHRCLDWQHGNAQHGSCVPSEGASGLNLESAPPGGCEHLVTRCVLYGGPQ